MKTGSTTEAVVIDEILTNKVWFYEWDISVRLTAISVKIEPQGILAIFKGITAEGPMVAFMGAPSLTKLAFKVRDPNGRAAVKWRTDHFALAHLEKSG